MGQVALLGLCVASRMRLDSMVSLDSDSWIYLVIWKDFSDKVCRSMSNLDMLTLDFSNPYEKVMIREYGE